MNFEQNLEINNTKENKPSKTSDVRSFFIENHILGNLHLDQIEVDREFIEHPELSKEVKRKFIENNIFPVKNDYIPETLFRGMKNNNLNFHKNQIKTFKSHVNNVTLDSINTKIKRIFTGSNYKPSGFDGNWFGYTLFTTPQEGYIAGYTKSFFEKKGGLVSEFSIKKKNPILIKETDARKLVEHIPNIDNKNGLRDAHKILENLKIDGILYESDGNAIAWLDPESTLELKRITRNSYMTENPGLGKTVVFEKNNSTQNETQ